MFLQHGPWWINMKSGKKQARVFSSQMNRRTGHGSMMMIDHVNQLLCSPVNKPHLENSVSDGGIDTLTIQG